MTPERILSFDFETANHSAVSICAAGVAIIENGQLVGTRHWLVRPPQGHGWFRDDFIEIHGITHEDVAGDPEFPEVTKKFLLYLTRADLAVVHNAPFDLRKLQGTLSNFGLACPSCSCHEVRRAWPELPNHNLNSLASRIGHEFHHHEARSDAEAAGRIFNAILTERGERWGSNCFEPLNSA